MNEDDLIEVLARAYCVAAGVDPDQRDYTGDPEEAHLCMYWSLWEEQAGHAQKTIQALKAAGYEIKEVTK